jgi:hypothetical protein
MRCYCEGDVCHCDGIVGELSAVEARQILKDRRQVHGHDSVPDEMMRRVEKEVEMSKSPHGRDLYMLRLQRAMDR